MKYNKQQDLPYPQPWEFILDSIYQRKNCTELFYVDIGANDGLAVSNTAYLEMDLNWNGICIEPHPEAFLRLEQNRKCKKYNCCIGDSEKQIKFISVKGYAEMLSCVVTDSNHFINQHKQRIESEIQKYGGEYSILDIECKKLDSILDENNVNHVDYLSIDTEGSEFDVIKSINFDKTKINVISVEDNNDENVPKYLIDRGYKFINKIGADYIFVSNDF